MLRQDPPPLPRPASPSRVAWRCPARSLLSLSSLATDVQPQEGGGWDVSAWFDVKGPLKEKNALMNLPYVLDGARLYEG